MDDPQDNLSLEALARELRVGHERLATALEQQSAELARLNETLQAVNRGPAPEEAALQVTHAIRELARRFEAFSQKLEAQLQQQGELRQEESRQLLATLATVGAMAETAERTLTQLTHALPAPTDEDEWSLD